MDIFLTPNGYTLSVSREEGIYFIGWVTIDQEEGQALEKISTPLPHDTEVTFGGRYHGPIPGMKGDAADGEAQNQVGAE